MEMDVRRFAPDIHRISFNLEVLGKVHVSL